MAKEKTEEIKNPIDNAVASEHVEMGEGESTESQVYKEQVKVKNLGNQELVGMSREGSINLLPTKTIEELELDKKKSGVSYLSVITVLVISVVSMVIIGFNFANRAILNNQREELATQENQIRQNGRIIEKNDTILESFNLYQDIEESTFSPKEVLLYWLLLSEEFGEINKVEMTGGLSFTFDGKTDDLTDASRLWHLLSVDDRVESITLESVSKSEEGVSYKFEGTLDLEYFLLETGQITEN